MDACGSSNVSKPTFGVYPAVTTDGSGVLPPRGLCGADGEPDNRNPDPPVLANCRPGELELRYGDVLYRRGGELGTWEGVEGREDECFIAERSGGGGSEM